MNEITEIILYISGNVWVFEVYETVVYDDDTSASFCDQTCYLFAFWSIIVQWIFIGLSFLCISISCLLAMCLKCADDNVDYEQDKTTEIESTA